MAPMPHLGACNFLRLLERSRLRKTGKGTQYISLVAQQQKDTDVHALSLCASSRLRRCASVSCARACRTTEGQSCFHMRFASSLCCELSSESGA